MIGFGLNELEEIEVRLDGLLRWIDSLRSGETCHKGAALDAALDHAFEAQAALLARRRALGGAA